MSKVTAERDALDDFAPEFAEMNDDVLFGETWSREQQWAPIKAKELRNRQNRRWRVP